MIHESQDIESMARMLKQEREELIVAWEQLESEQRQLALTGGNAQTTTSAREEASAPPADTQSTSPTVLPAPNSIVRTVSAAMQPPGASNTFRFLQQEFDKPDERSSK